MLLIRVRRHDGAPGLQTPSEMLEQSMALIHAAFAPMLGLRRDSVLSGGSSHELPCATARADLHCGPEARKRVHAEEGVVLQEA